MALAPDGTELWETQLQGTFAPSLAIGVDGTVYVWNGALTALWTGGSVLWTVSPTAYPTASPLALGGDGTVRIVDAPPSENPSVYVIDGSGTTVSTIPLPAGKPLSPLTLGPDGSMYLVVRGAGTQLVALTTSGAVEWTTQVQSGSGGTLSVGIDGTVYVPTGNGLTAYTAAGTQRWAVTSLEGAIEQVAVADDGTSFAATFSGGLYAFASDGTRTWYYQSDGTQDAVIADGTGAGYASFVNFPPGSNLQNVARFAANGPLTWAIPDAGVPRALGTDGTVYALAPPSVAGPYTTLVAIAQ